MAQHTRDSDCTLGTDGCCIECGVAHGDPCHLCGGRGFHADDCPEIFDRDSAEYEDRYLMWQAHSPELQEVD